MKQSKKMLTMVIAFTLVTVGATAAYYTKANRIKTKCFEFNVSRHHVVDREHYNNCNVSIDDSDIYTGLHVLIDLDNTPSTIEQQRSYLNSRYKDTPTIVEMVQFAGYPALKIVRETTGSKSVVYHLFKDDEQYLVVISLELETETTNIEDIDNRLANSLIFK